MDDWINDLPYSPLEDKVCQAARALFAECVARVEEESFYGFALCPDCDVRSFYWLASTEESLRRTAERWLDQTRRRFPERKRTIELALALHRFQVADWEYGEEWLRKQGIGCLPTRQAHSEAGDALDAVWESFEQIPMDEDTMFERADSVRCRCLDAIVRGLQRFDAETVWEPRIDRTKFVVLVFIPDPDDPEEIRDMAQRLNPPDAFRDFSRQYYADEPWWPQE